VICGDPATPLHFSRDTAPKLLTPNIEGPQSSSELEGIWRRVKWGFRMVWLSVVVLIGTAFVLAGRAHSRHLDRLEEKLSLKILLASPARIRSESAKPMAAETDYQPSIAISVGDQMWIFPQGLAKLA
jgi:hypothetical protein